MELGGFVSFREYFKNSGVADEDGEIRESVIHKIKHLYLITEPNKIVQEFKKIFDINDNITYEKIEIGGNCNKYTGHIKYSSNNSLLHELIHYLQVRTKKFPDYKEAEFSDCGILNYMLQPMELNNWAISLADEAFDFSSFDSFMSIGKETKDFEKADRIERLKHIIYLLNSDIECNYKTSRLKQKLIKLSRQYYFIVKSLKQDIKEYLVDERHII